MNNAKQKAKVLVIEDEPLLLEAIEKKFNQSELPTAAFTSAKKALKYLRDHIETNQLPKIIWLDYYLEDMSGLEFVKKIKKIPPLGEIPILVISNSATNKKVQEFLDLGVEKYLIKANYRLKDLINLTSETIRKE